jgi:hypothetical protein
MDLQELQRRAQAARETTHTLGAIDYRLRLPTSHEVLLAAHKAGVVGQAVGAAYLVLMRAVLEGAIVGWQGVRVGDVAPGGDDAATPLPWAAGVVPLLLDARPTDERALADVLSQRMAERATALEADTKN